jgi:NADH-quinone oxidoreductase subunit L
VALVAALITFYWVMQGNSYNGSLYTWAELAGVTMQIGFLVDSLTATMMVVVTFVSLMVHIYTIGYMEEDPGYQRFFSYISLFTFSMMMLVMANNFLQLFFGWEAVGLVSYLLIGFWYTKDTAIYANMKAFLVNRVGDFGFLLGIGLVLAWFGSLQYDEVFATAPGPTPISALIHAATMVTAGIFMVARMSPLFEMSDTALSFIIVIGAITALFMGLLGIIQNDIKRVVAYSTLSQLGYMTIALGASAYSVAIFHLMTHAFFKALLFLAAGSVIIGMHHDQDIRNMGGLRKYMPITWITSLIGTLALVGTPFFSGFFSKESIIEAAKFATIPGATFAYWCALIGVFITSFYSFRLYFLVFHGKERWGQHDDGHHDDAHDGAHDDGHHHGLKAGDKPHETPWVVTVPLVLLAIPSVVIGCIAIDALVFGSFFDGVITVDPKHTALETFREHYHGFVAMGMHGFQTVPFWLMVAGAVTAGIFYLLAPSIPAAIKRVFQPVHALLENKYFFDRFNEIVFAGGSLLIGRSLWKGGDQTIIDGAAVNGSARLVNWFSGVVAMLQTGRMNNYAITMIVGVVVLLGFVVWPLVSR